MRFAERRFRELYWLSSSPQSVARVSSRPQSVAHIVGCPAIPSSNSSTQQLRTARTQLVGVHQIASSPARTRGCPPDRTRQLARVGVHQIAAHGKSVHRPHRQTVSVAKCRLPPCLNRWQAKAHGAELAWYRLFVAKPNATAFRHCLPSKRAYFGCGCPGTSAWVSRYQWVSRYHRYGCPGTTGTPQVWVSRYQGTSAEPFRRTQRHQVWPAPGLARGGSVSR